MGVLRDKVRAILEGSEQRQAERDAARNMARIIRLIYHYRKEGAMNTLSSAESVLTRLGVQWEVDVYYGVSQLSTRVGVVLAYGPTGKFAWGTGPHVEHSLTGDQLEIFTDDFPSG